MSYSTVFTVILYSILLQDVQYLTVQTVQLYFTVCIDLLYRLYGLTVQFVQFYLQTVQSYCTELQSYCTDCTALPYRPYSLCSILRCSILLSGSYCAVQYLTVQYGVLRCHYSILRYLADPTPRQLTLQYLTVQYYPSTRCATVLYGIL